MRLEELNRLSNARLEREAVERGRIENNLRIVQGELESRVQEGIAELKIANEGLQHLSAHLIQSQDNERRRLARELHDSVGTTAYGDQDELGCISEDTA